MLLFTKKGCEKCDFIKEKLVPDNNIKILDIETVDGLTELSWLALADEANKTLPILVEFPKGEKDKQNKVVTSGAINIKNVLIKKKKIVQ